MKNEKTLFKAIQSSMVEDLSPYLPDHILTAFNAGTSIDYKTVLSALDTPTNQVSVYPHRQAAAIAMLSHFTKKYAGRREVEIADQATREKAAWDAFLADNLRCKAQNGKLSRGESLGDLTDLVLNESVKIFEDLFWKALDDDACEVLLTKGGRHLVPRAGFSTGPGVCNSSLYEKHSNRNVHDKYSDGLVVATEAGVSYMNYLAKVAPWMRGLPTEIKVEDCTQAEIVPKNDVIGRLIGPCNNGDLLLHYPYAAFLTRMYRHAGLTLGSLQPIHQALSRVGSRMRHSQLRTVLKMQRGLGNSDGRFLTNMEDGDVPCTMDMKGGSNCVGVELVKRHAPAPLFHALMSTRPNFIAWKGNKVEIEAMALMGNGYCFPLQTLIFWCICKAVCRLYGAPRAFVTVFGDDIIIPKSAYDRVAHVLESLHMVVNRTKSFSTGLFRESCGGDFYDGYPVKPVQFAGLRAVSDRYTLINALVEHGTFHSILYKRTLRVLLSSIPAGHRRSIPCDFDGSWGLRVPEHLLPHLDPSWKKNVRVSTTRNSLIPSGPSTWYGEHIMSPKWCQVDDMNVYHNYEVGIMMEKPATLLRSAKRLRMFDVLRCRVPTNYRGEESITPVDDSTEAQLGEVPDGSKFYVNGNRTKSVYVKKHIPWWDAPVRGSEDFFGERELILITATLVSVMGLDE